MLRTGTPNTIAVNRRVNILVLGDREMLSGIPIERVGGGGEKKKIGVIAMIDKRREKVRDNRFAMFRHCRLRATLECGCISEAKDV